MSSPPATPFSDQDRLLSPGEVAAIFRVHPKTVTRWADAGKVWSTRTPGGHRRYSRAEFGTAPEAAALPASVLQEGREALAAWDKALGSPCPADRSQIPAWQEASWDAAGIVAGALRRLLAAEAELADQAGDGAAS
jgi:excisionase family DNA binding protein